MKIFKPEDYITKCRQIQFLKQTEKEHDLVKSLNFDDVIKYKGFEKKATWYKSDMNDYDVSYLLMENVEGIMLIDFFN